MKLDIATILFLLLMINGSLSLIFFGAWLKRPSEVYLRAAVASLSIAIGLASAMRSLKVGKQPIETKTSINRSAGLTR